MALKKFYSLPTGIALPDSYHRIRSVMIDRAVGTDGTDESVALIRMEMYKDAASRSAGLQPISSFEIPVHKGDEGFDQHFSTSALDGSNVNIVSQAYSYLKGQSDITRMEWGDVHLNYTDTTNV